LESTYFASGVMKQGTLVCINNNRNETKLTFFEFVDWDQIVIAGALDWISESLAEIFNQL